MRPFTKDAIAAKVAEKTKAGIDVGIGSNLFYFKRVIMNVLGC